MQGLNIIMPGTTTMEAFWTISLSTAGFLIYHFFSQWDKSGRSNDKKPGYPSNNLKQVLFQRFLGFLVYGLVPFLFTVFFFRLPVKAYGINLMNMQDVIMWVLILSPLVIILNYFNASKDSNLGIYPQIRKKNWSGKTVWVSAGSWIIYLVAYEYMFRGFLLFSFCHLAGAEIAIAVNTSLYALFHIPKGLKETYGAVPLGIILCILTLSTGNIWIAVIVHIVMALSNEWFSLKAHPEINLIKGK